jgi:hypothetical protein
MAEFEKRPELYDYEANTPEKRNRGFKSMLNPTSKMDTLDKILLAGYEAANAADWGQTLQISRNPEQHSEAPLKRGGSAGLIGRHPSRDKVNLLMGGQAAAVPYIANQLPSGWRKALLGSLFVGKALTVNQNTKGINGLPMVRW